MVPASDLSAFLRFAAGSLVSVLAGCAIFRLATFEPSEPWFQCITAGAFLAGVLALTRIGRSAQAVSLAFAFALVHVGYAWSLGVGAAIWETAWSLVLGGGALLCAVIFDHLANEGYRFGKFALLGPLMAGVYLAATMVTLLGPDRVDPIGTLVRHMFVGLVVGDAVGLGVELVELLPGVAPRAPGLVGPS